MSVSAIHLGTVGAVAPRAAGGARAAPAAADIGPAAVTKISKEGDMLSRLGDLETADPDKLQATLETVADRLRAASMEKGGQEGERLAAMADKADAAARTGDLSKLKPPGRSPRGGTRPCTPRSCAWRGVRSAGWRRASRALRRRAPRQARPRS